MSGRVDYLNESGAIIRRIVSKLNDGWGADPSVVWEIANMMLKQIHQHGKRDFDYQLCEPPMNQWFEWEVRSGWMQKMQRGAKNRYALTSDGERLADVRNERGLHQVISRAIGCDYLSLERSIPWDNFKH